MKDMWEGLSFSWQYIFINISSIEAIILSQVELFTSPSLFTLALSTSSCIYANFCSHKASSMLSIISRAGLPTSTSCPSSYFTILLIFVGISLGYNIQLHVIHLAKSYFAQIKQILITMDIQILCLYFWGIGSNGKIPRSPLDIMLRIIDLESLTKSIIWYLSTPHIFHPSLEQKYNIEARFHLLPATTTTTPKRVPLFARCGEIQM